MLELICGRRLEVETEFIPVDDLAETPIRATEWNFVLKWSDGAIPDLLRINNTIIKEWADPEPVENGKWPFSLPPTVRNLTRIEVEAASGDDLIKVLNVIPAYQLPEQHLREALNWLTFYREIWEIFAKGGEISILDLIEGKSTFYSDESTEIIKEDIPREIRIELAELFEKVLRSPRRRLINENYLVDPGEIQRVTPATVDYFARHPETWQSRSHLRPRPVKLLDERTVEDFNIYENRFVLYFLKQLDTRLKRLILQYQLASDELNLSVPEAEMQANYGWFYQASTIQELRNQRMGVHRNLKEMCRFLGMVHQLQAAPMFTKVRRLARAPRINTTLQMHPVYGRLYQLYEQINQEQFSHKQINWLEEAQRTDLRTTYLRYCFLMVLRAILDCRFALEGNTSASVPIFRGDEGIPFTNLSVNGNWQLLFQHIEYSTATVKVTYVGSPEYPALADTIRLEFQFTSKENQSVANAGMAYVWLIPDPTWWGTTKGEARETDWTEKQRAILDLYHQLVSIHDLVGKPNAEETDKRQTASKRKKSRQKKEQPQAPPVTILLLHPTPPSDFDDRLDYSDLRLLLNQGDNFVTAEDYEKYGGYQVGCLPLYPAGSSEFRGLLRLKRLIRVQMFRLGLDDLCWNCFQKAANHGSNEQKRYECQNSGCRLRWGEVSCSKCRNRYIKMKTPDKTLQNATTWDISIDEIVSAKMAVTISEALEGRLSVSSACEDLDRAGDFWAICPYCGHCEKENTAKNCWRCKMRRELDT